LCHSAAVPLTTALRWVGRLEEDGWLVRREDALDRRRIWIDLSPSAFKTMESYFQFVAAGLPPI
jgi:DNA-binding MarR family transcriptional regulator